MCQLKKLYIQSYKMKKIIIVEDVEEQLKCIYNYLTTLYPNLEFYIAKNGLEAYNIIKKLNIEIIFTDIKIPKMNGLQLIKKVKEEINENIKTIVTSGDIRLEEIIPLNIDLVLHKPFSFDRLKEGLDILINDD